MNECAPGDCAGPSVNWRVRRPLSVEMGHREVMNVMCLRRYTMEHGLQGLKNHGVSIIWPFTMTAFAEYQQF